jgi:hypothetical protein
MKSPNTNSKGSYNPTTPNNHFAGAAIREAANLSAQSGSSTTFFGDGGGGGAGEPELGSPHTTVVHLDQR